MGRIFITPLAKKLASLNSINIKDIEGTGPRGRITKIDIEKHLKLSSPDTNIEQKNKWKFKNREQHFKKLLIRTSFNLCKFYDNVFV